MEEKLTEQEMQFIGFISMLANTALFQMGKVAHPVTGKTEKDLAAAQVTIEMLKMLREKTKGNLTKNEEEVLREYLSHLQFNYVEELEKDQKERHGEGKTEKKQEIKPEEKKPEAKEPEEKPAPGTDDIVLNWEKQEPKKFGSEEKKK